MPEQILNSILTHLTGAINNSQTTGITVAAVPAGPITGTVRAVFAGNGAEIISFTGYTGSGPYTLTGVARGSEGTTAVIHAINDSIGIAALTSAALVASFDPIGAADALAATLGTAALADTADFDAAGAAAAVPRTIAGQDDANLGVIADRQPIVFDADSGDYVPGPMKVGIDGGANRLRLPLNGQNYAAINLDDDTGGQLFAFYVDSGAGTANLEAGPATSQLNFNFGTDGPPLTVLSAFADGHVEFASGATVVDNAGRVGIGAGDQSGSLSDFDIALLVRGQVNINDADGKSVRMGVDSGTPYIEGDWTGLSPLPLSICPNGGHVLINTEVDDGFNALQVNGSATLGPFVSFTAVLDDHTQLEFLGTSGNLWVVGNNVVESGTGHRFEIYDWANSRVAMAIEDDGGAAFASGLVTIDGSGVETAVGFVGPLTGTASGNPPNSRVVATGFGMLGGGNLASDPTPIAINPAVISATRTSTILISQSGAVASVATFTPSADGTYRVGAWATITAVAVDVLNVQVTYTDQTNTARTMTFFPQGLTSASLAATGAYGFPTIDIRAKSSTAITVKTILAVGGGTITYDVGGTIQQLA